MDQKYDYVAVKGDNIFTGRANPPGEPFFIKRLGRDASPYHFGNPIRKPYRANQIRISFKKGSELYPFSNRPFQVELERRLHQMLDIYLARLRTLKRRPTETAGVNTVNPADVKIFIVEGREDTRAKVREFDNQYQLKTYDGSIPVIYVFNSGRWVKTYTYSRDPGPNGLELKALVESLLAK